jgi:hypothetical protein
MGKPCAEQDVVTEYQRNVMAMQVGGSNRQPRGDTVRAILNAIGELEAPLGPVAEKRIKLIETGR